LLYFICVCEAHQPYPSPSFPSFTLPTSDKYPPHCTYFTVLFLIFNSKVSVQRGFSTFPSCEYNVLGSGQSLLLLPLTLSLLPRHSALSVCFIMSSTYADAMCFDIVDLLSFSFPSLHLQVPSLQTCSKCKCVYNYVWFL
jgi:hypothetical protein